MWRNTVNFNVEARKITKPLDTCEGALWTNAHHTSR
jgi:hypothetical protein